MSHLTLDALPSDILALITPWLLIEDLIRLKSMTATVSSRLHEPGVIRELRVALPKLPPPPLTSYLTKIVITGADESTQYSEQQDLSHMKWLQSLPRTLEVLEVIDDFPLFVDDPATSLPWFVREWNGHIPVRLCELFPNLRTFKWTVLSSSWIDNVWPTCLQIWFILGLPATLENLKLPFWLEDAILPHLPPHLKSWDRLRLNPPTPPLLPDGWVDSIEALSCNLESYRAADALSVLKDFSRLQTLKLNFGAFSSILPHLPSTLTDLTLKFSSPIEEQIKGTCTPAHLARLPRHITSLTMESPPQSLVLGEFFPPNLTYLHVKGLNNRPLIMDSMFKELPTCLLSLKILKIHDAQLASLSWLPCDRLTTFHLKSTRDVENWSEKLSSIPPTRPNNITNLKLDCRLYGEPRLPPLHLLPPKLFKWGISCLEPINFASGYGLGDYEKLLEISNSLDLRAPILTYTILKPLYHTSVRLKGSNFTFDENWCRDEPNLEISKRTFDNWKIRPENASFSRLSSYLHFSIVSFPPTLTRLVLQTAYLSPAVLGLPNLKYLNLRRFNEPDEEEESDSTSFSNTSLEELVIVSFDNVVGLVSEHPSAFPNLTSLSVGVTPQSPFSDADKLWNAIPKLSSLTIGGPSNLQNLTPSLPNSVTSLRIHLDVTGFLLDKCSHLRNLRALSISYPPLPNDPSSRIHPHQLAYFPLLTDLDTSRMELMIGNHEDALKSLPRDLQEIHDIDMVRFWCPNIEKFSGKLVPCSIFDQSKTSLLPPSLTSLSIYNVDGDFAQGLPGNLTDLRAGLHSSSASIQHELPPSLTSLKLWKQCDFDANLPPLMTVGYPPRLEHLTLSYANFQGDFFQNLPPKLRHLHVNQLPDPHFLLQHLPASITELGGFVDTSRWEDEDDQNVIESELQAILVKFPLKRARFLSNGGFLIMFDDWEKAVEILTPFIIQEHDRKNVQMEH